MRPSGPLWNLPSAGRRWAVVSSVLESGLSCAALLGAYAVLPLSAGTSLPELLRLVVAVVVVAAVVARQVWAVLRSGRPVLRAVRALCVSVLFLLVVFAALYVKLSAGDPRAFTHPLTRIDALYFTVSVFATVGFGDLAAMTQLARLVVTVQMLLDLVVLGVVIRVLSGAARRSLVRGRPGHDKEAPPRGRRP
ncbi:potassium channel family protein [Streptomyces sp. enrichment culture]|uniref:potassium channel family protein n=1 Tax=Streptomyces sp. enrichment culture TaxID=1795815 RepID=UPI003F55F47D